MRSSSTMISVPSRIDHRALLGEVERHDRDVLAGRCTARCRARSSSTAGRRGCSRPCACARCRAARARAAGSSDPSGAAPSGTRRCAPWRGDFSSSRRAPPNAASKPYLSSACFRACVFMTSVCMRRAVRERVDALRDAFLVEWTIRSSPSSLRHRGRGTRIISRNFHVVSTCSSGNGGLRRIEGLHRQVQHHGAVLADRIQHHRAVRTRRRPRA